MRIVVLIIGLLVGLLLFLQSFTIGIFSDTSAISDVTATAGGVGLLMALMWLFASAMVIPFPQVSTFVFLVTVPMGLFVPTGEFKDIRFHGVVAIVLTLMSFSGWCGKRKQAREKALELQAQRERDMRMEALLRQSHQAAQPSVSSQMKSFCPSCGSQNDAGNRFCASCGTSLVPAQASMS